MIQMLESAPTAGRTASTGNSSAGSVVKVWALMTTKTLRTESYTAQTMKTTSIESKDIITITNKKIMTEPL